MPAPLVSLRSVGVTLGRTPVLTDVSFELEAGSALGIAGPNGSGKSTLLSLVGTFLRPSSGDGAVLEAPLGSREVFSVRPHIGWVGHDAGLHPHLTLVENLRLETDARGLDVEGAHRALRAVGLGGAADRLTRDCSNGMRRRADLARLLIHPPRLVLLDEAEAGLDEPAHEIIDHVIRATCDRGGATIMVTHDAGRLDARFDRVHRLESGVLV